MDKYVAGLNIQHYRELIAKEKDETKRQQLSRLLAEEEAKLEQLLKNKPHKSQNQA